MATAKKTQIVITANAAVAKKVMDELQQRIDGIKQKMASLDVTTKQGQREFKKLEKELVSYNSAVTQNITNTERINKAMKNLSGTSLNELKRALSAAKSELGKMSSSSKGLKEMQGNVKALQGQIDKLTGSVHKQSGAWNTALKNLTAYVGMFAVFNQVKTYIFDVFRLNAKFAEQLTNIRKVALSTQEEVGRLAKDLAKIDTRTSIETLNQIAYSGAKLGITTQNLAGFVRAADQVNVALKEDLGEEALTALAKITEVMGLIDKYGVEDAMLRTGSSIFRLASTSTACSGQIVDFSNRMLALGDAAALSTPDILAIGAAVDSMALEPEVAATAFGKLVVELRKGTSSIEKDLGIAQGSLKKMVEEGKGMEAIQTIFRKMHESKNVFALNSLFKDLGSEDGARLTKVMVTMAEKVDMLDKAVTESNKAFNEGTAVTTEYEMQQETAMAYMERAANLFEKQFVTANAANGPVRDLAKSWYEMVDALVHNITFMTEAKILITLLMASMQTFLKILPTLITVIGTAGVAGAFAKLAELTTGLTGKTLSLASAWETMVTSYKKLSFVKQMSVWGGLIGLAGILVVKLAQWSASLNKIAAGQRVLNEVQEEGTRQAMEEQESLKRLRNVMHDTTASMDLRRQAMDKLNSAIPDLNAKINSETGAVQENTKAWKDNFKRLQNYYELEGARSKLSELGRKKVDAILNLQKKEDAYANTNVDVNPGRPVTSGGAVMGSQAQGAIGQAGQKAAAKRERDAAQREYDDIVAQENALQKKFGSKLYADGKPEGNGGKTVGGGNGGGSNGSNTGNPNRNEKNVAKDRANALIANIKSFYEEQMRKYLEWVTQMNADGEKISEGQQKEQINYLQSQMDKALGTARQSIATLDDGWQKFYQHMDEDVMVYDEETSKQLLESIGKSDITELHKLFSKLSSDLSRENNRTLAENLGALLDQMFANGSKELREAAEKLLARQREIQNILNEHDYTGAVDRKTRSNFDSIGFLHPAENINVDTPEGLDTMNAAFDKLTTKARESITVLYELDPEGKEFQDRFLQFLSVANKGFDFSKLTTQDLKALYLELIKYSDEYTAAEKKNADERKKINDFLWNRQGFQADQDNRRHDVQQVGSGVERFRKAGKGEDSENPRSGEMGGSKFMDEFSYNMNLEQSRLEIVLLQEKIAWLQQYGATSEQVAELQKSLAEKQDSYILALMQTMKQRAEAVYALYKPLEDFGTAAGQAFATMTEDAEAGRDAFKAAIGDMINAMMKQTVQMTQEYIKRRLMQKVNDKLVSTQIKKSTKEQVSLEQGGADATSAITEAAGDAKVMLTEQVGKQVVNAVTAQTQETTNTSQAAAVADVNTEAAKTEANVGLGIAGGAAKTIGSLGWWGIPLIAVITAVLNGLLGFAMGKVSSLFGKGKENNTNTKNTKVVSGMLTYDSGNVQDLKPFVGNDGSLYWATEGSKPHDGVSLLTQPTATTINGQPSLVAESGPELVIGRETTQAMMMNNPQLLKALVNYDRNYSGRRAYDTGNIAETSHAIATGASVNEESAIAQANASAALLQAVNTLLQRLEQPIEAKIDMYGRGKLYDSMTKANQFMKNK